MKTRYLAAILTIVTTTTAPTTPAAPTEAAPEPRKRFEDLTSEERAAMDPEELDAYFSPQAAAFRRKIRAIKKRHGITPEEDAAYLSFLIKEGHL